MTLGQLRARLDAYINRVDPDYVNNRIDFLNTGMRYVERKFLAPEPMYGRWSTVESLPAGVGTLPLPACYRHSAELRLYRLPTRQRLQRVQPVDLNNAFLLNGTEINLSLRQDTPMGTPGYFSVLGRSLALRPLSATTEDYEIVGTGWAEPMKVDDDETVVSQEAPDAILYAACREVWLFLGDEPQAVYWQTQADKAIAEWIGDRLAEEHPPQLVMETPG